MLKTRIESQWEDREDGGHLYLKDMDKDVSIPYFHGVSNVPLTDFNKNDSFLRADQASQNLNDSSFDISRRRF